MRGSWRRALGCALAAIGALAGNAGAVTITEHNTGLPANQWPAYITPGPDGNVWFTLWGCGVGPSRPSCAIGRITPAGAITEFTAGLPANSFPTVITTGPDGNLWFTDQACNGGSGTCAVGKVALELPPAVANGDSTGVAATGAEITGSVNSRGAAVSRIAVRYQVGHGAPRTVTASPSTLPAGGVPVAVTGTLTGLPPDQTITYAIQATNAYGATTGPAGTLHTSRGPAPTISDVTQSHRRWRRGLALASISRRRPRSPVGTTFSFRLNEAAALQAQSARVRIGRKVSGRCVAVTRGNRRRARCTRLTASGTLRFSGYPGRNRIRFEGRLSARRSLAVGTYQVRVLATALAARADRAR